MQTISKIIIPCIILVFFGCSQSVNTINKEVAESSSASDEIKKEVKSEITFDSTINWSNLTKEDWKKRLNDQEYYVLREKGTERAFSGELLENKRQGTYVCAGCHTPLYSSKTKFKSGTGWPSFYDIIEGNVLSVVDNSYGMRRTEVICATCKGHQGHVFSDGPNPTGLRYCINSVSIKFVEE
mgnify:CR=1 FL=1